MRKELSKSFCLLLRSIWLILSVSTGVYAQTDSLNAIKSQFDQYSKKVLQEKVFVHTDKNLYLAGEILWFKIYNVDAAFNKPLELSKVAYLEILDKDQRQVLQAKISIEKGHGNGSLYLPVSLASGNYQIRAYTKWMENFSPEYFFEKNIIIVNSFKNPDELQPKKNILAYDIQFFPEGGNMVEGIPGKVAFRAIDQNGKGIDFRGALIDDNNDTLIRFQPLKFGIGSFAFTPRTGNIYKAVIYVPGINPVIKELPSVYKTGYVMSVNDAGAEKIQVSVQTNTSSSAGMVYLFIHTRQETKIAETALINNGKAEFLIDKSKLDEGISHFTVFNSVKKPVCERLYFKRPFHKLMIDADVGQQQYSSRKKVTITILAKDESGKQQEADVSMSVYPASSLESDQADIFSYLWLSSDLVGNVESPGYYFKSNDSETNEALNNLMLTHGWRRFVWEDVLKNKTLSFRFLPEYEGHIISGKITDTRTGEVASNILTYLAVPGKKLHLYGSRSNNNGDIRFYTRDIYGPAEIVVQTNTLQDTTYRIEISSPFSEKFSVNRSSGFNLIENMRNQLLTQSIGSQVQNVYTGNKLKMFYPPQIDSNAFYMQADKRYFLDNYVRFKTMEEVLREYVTEVSVTKQRNDFYLSVVAKSHYNNSYQNVEPLLLLDGVPVFDHGNKIISYDPMKVQKLEIVAKKYFLGPLVFNSIVNFSTYKGNLPDFQLDPRATVLDYEGLQLNREFYSPVYETESQISNRLPDFRNVLYWSPDIKIDKSGKKAISFYTSDQENKYTVIVQGINQSGRSGISTFNIEVKK